MTRKKLHVCLIEYENHYEVIRSLAQFFQDSNWQVNIISNKNCQDNLYDLRETPAISFSLFESIKMGDFIHFDLVIYVTPFDYHQIKKPLIGPNQSYLMIHNHNYWLDPFKNIFFLKRFNILLVYNFLKLLKYWKIDTAKENNEFIQSFKGVISPSMLIFSKLSKTNHLNGFLDVGYSNNNYNKEFDVDIFKIAIPGVVTKDKDPRFIIQQAKALAESEMAKIEIYLLGENRIIPINNLKKYNSDYFKVYSYDKPLSQEKFDAIMKTIDLGIIPMKKYKDYKGILEIKGVTNISGGISDMYRFNIPFIIPHYYKVVKLHPSIYNYKDVIEIKSILKNHFRRYSKTKNQKPLFEEIRQYIFDKNRDSLNSLMNQ